MIDLAATRCIVRLADFEMELRAQIDDIERGLPARWASASPYLREDAVKMETQRELLEVIANRLKQILSPEAL